MNPEKLSRPHFDPEELRRLTRLSRRFASPNDTHHPLTADWCEFDLSWNVPPLEFAVVSALPTGHYLREMILADPSNLHGLIRIWREVERLPYATVERMILVTRSSYWVPPWKVILEGKW